MHFVLSFYKSGHVCTWIWLHMSEVAVANTGWWMIAISNWLLVFFPFIVITIYFLLFHFITSLIFKEGEFCMLIIYNLCYVSNARRTLPVSLLFSKVIPPCFSVQCLSTIRTSAIIIKRKLC